MEHAISKGYQMQAIAQILSITFAVLETIIVLKIK
jgi:hypothetical protein